MNFLYFWILIKNKISKFFQVKSQIYRNESFYLWSLIQFWIHGSNLLNDNNYFGPIFFVLFIFDNKILIPVGVKLEKYDDDILCFILSKLNKTLSQEVIDGGSLNGVKSTEYD